MTRGLGRLSDHYRWCPIGNMMLVCITEGDERRIITVFNVPPNDQCPVKPPKLRSKHRSDKAQAKRRRERYVT